MPPPVLEDRLEDHSTVVATQTGALTTATVAAVANANHLFLKCEASYSNGASSGLLEIKFGTTVVGSKYIHGAGAIDAAVFGMKNPNQNEAISAELAAVATVTGTVTLSYYTRR